MQKKAIPIAIAIAIVVAMFIISRVTGALQVYKVSSPSCLPTFTIGKYVISSNLRSVETNRYLFFYQYDSSLSRTAVWFHRCVGMPGDTLLMKKGTLYVNGKQGSIENKVWRMYLLRTDRIEFWLAKYKDRLEEHTQQNISSSDTLVALPFNKQEAENVQSMLQPNQTFTLYDLENYIPDYFSQLQQQNWTINDFGPYVVPESSYFVLGDNRHNAMDSRFIGPIEQSAIRGVLLTDN